MKLIVMFLLCALLPLGSAAQKPEVSVDSDLLASLLGEMPEKMPLQIDTLESCPLDGGVRLNAFSEAYLSNGGKDIETLLFEENGGRHCFPPKVKEKAYSWLDRHLKRY